MSTEVYSKRMAVAVRRDLRQANGKRFDELLTYYRRRGGPGLALAEAEQQLREKRHSLNYPSQAAPAHLTNESANHSARGCL